MRHHWHHNHTEVTEMPDSEVEEQWRMTLPAVSLTFGILASAFFALRVYTSRIASRKIRAEDLLMGISVVLMWGTVASVLLSTSVWCRSCYAAGVANFLNRSIQWYWSAWVANTATTKTLAQLCMWPMPFRRLASAC